MNEVGEDHRGMRTIEPDQEEQSTNQGGSHTPPSREVQSQSPSCEKTNETDDPHAAVSEYIVNVQKNIKLAENTLVCQTEQPEVEQEDLSGGSEEPPRGE